MIKTYKVSIVLATFALIFAGCAKNEVIEEQHSRTLSITATLEEPAATRAVLYDDAGTIRFEWQTSDVIQMVFVQGAIKKTANATIVGVTNNGRTARFTVTVPVEITGDFFLYAYRSNRMPGITQGSELDGDNPVIAVLPQEPWVYYADFSRQHYLVSLWAKKEVTYGGGPMPDVSLSFQHLGAMMTVKVKNNTAEEVKDIREIWLRGTSNWVKNGSAFGMAHFDMSAGDYVGGKELPNITLAVATNMSRYGGIAPGDVKTYYVWFVPGLYTAGNEIKLEAKSDGFETLGVSANAKEQKNFQPGKNYLMYMAINPGDGSLENKYNLKFTNGSFE